MPVAFKGSFVLSHDCRARSSEETAQKEDRIDGEGGADGKRGGP